MANYYNVTAWKNTGFDYMNRPATREVLEGEYFKTSGNYVQFKGVAVKRDDIMGLQYIDLQGSVKDLRGDQVNAPNSTGTHGPDGPWYRLEAIDYLRLVRTGYPGDVDFVDISGNMSDPWNATGAEGTHPQVYYFFVTGLQPMARNVTRLYLLLDTWTTLGGESELEIESGFKIRGHITEAEDAAGYNLAPENIGLLEPLNLIAKEELEYGTGSAEKVKDFYVSSIDLTQYGPENDVSAFLAQAEGGQAVAFPKILAVTDPTSIGIGWDNPDPDSGAITRFKTIFGYGFFDPSNLRVQNTISVLYSAGQLELQDSYSIPEKYISHIDDDGNGRYTGFVNNHFDVEPNIQQDISGYPRKADYYYGQEVVFSQLSGDMNIQPFYNLTNRNIIIWANLAPGGYPSARFAGIKDHYYIFDQSVMGMTWMKKAVILEGASGSMWAHIGYELQHQLLQSQMNKMIADNKTQSQLLPSQLYSGAWNAIFGGVNQGLGYANDEAAAKKAGTQLSFGQEVAANAGFLGAAISGAGSLAQQDANIQSYLNNQEFKEKSWKMATQQAIAQYNEATFQAPYTDFVPDMNYQMYIPNDFERYIINTGSKDRQRLKNYFLRYGYNGLYKPLTWDEINVKQRVNYIEAESVCVRHPIYPMRVTAEINNILQTGIFLWNEKPNQAAFSNNPDRA